MTSQQPHPFITMTSQRPHTSGNMTSQQPPAPNNLALLRDMEDQAVNVNFDILRIHSASTPHPHPHQSDDESDDVDKQAIKFHSDHSETRSAANLTAEDTDAHKLASTKPGIHTPPRHKQPVILADDSESKKEPNENGEEDVQEEKSFVLCKSPLRRQHLELPALTTRRTSMGNAVRRASLVRAGLGVEPKENSWQESQEFTHKEKSVTEKRMAMVRDKFSSKNLFNVRRQNTASCFADLYPGRSDNSLDASRKAMSGMALSQQRSLSGGQGRPVTSFFTAQGRQLQSNGSNRLTPRAATSSGPRIGRYGNNLSAIDSIFAGTRHPRSRRELEKLSQMRIDPFRDEEQGEEDEGGADGWMPVGDVHHDLLERLRRHGPVLQQRVSSFLKELERFNRRGHKTGLEQILEIK